MESVKKTVYYTEKDYYSLPDDIRTELIDGEFYDMAAPSQLHQELLIELCSIIRDHIHKRNGTCKAIPAPFDVKLESGKDNIVQPDISVICDKEKLDGKRCNGAPDWIIEITSPGNVSYDYVKKLKLYQKSGVREYWIVNPDDESIMAYCFESDNAKIEAYSFEDTVNSAVIPSLAISFPEILDSIS